MVVFHHSIENPPRHQGPSPPEARWKIRMFIYNMLNISCTCLSISYKYTYIYIHHIKSIYIYTTNIHIIYLTLSDWIWTYPTLLHPHLQTWITFFASFPRVQEMNSQCLPSLLRWLPLTYTPEALNREPKTHLTEKEHLNWTSEPPFFWAPKMNFPGFLVWKIWINYMNLFKLSK